MMNLIMAAVDFYGDWYGYLPLTIGAVIIAITIHSILLMLGRAFTIRELENFAKSEMLQTAATAFMAIFLVMMVGSAMEVSNRFIAGELDCGKKPIHIGETDESTMDDAYQAIRCRLQERATAVAEIQEAILNDVGLQLQFNVLNMQGSVFGITFIKGDWISSVYKETEKARITNNLATVLLIALNAQSSLLEYLRINMLNVFLPFGILLRSFYFTRGAGALFIALGIGMYFIFPIFFVLLDPGFTAAPPSTPTTTGSLETYCYPTMSNAVTMIESVEAAGLGTSSSLGMANIRNELSKSYISIILHPLIALFLTLIFMRYIMSIMGGDTYALTRMVSKVI